MHPRNCDPSSKERANSKMPGYVLFHRGDVNSGIARRKHGGFVGDGKGTGPCSKNTNADKVNGFVQTSGLTSQEELPLAMMQEGGRYTPKTGSVGDTKLASWVDRGPVFRCINKNENNGGSSSLLAVFF